MTPQYIAARRAVRIGAALVALAVRFGAALVALAARIGAARIGAALVALAAVLDPAPLAAQSTASFVVVVEGGEWGRIEVSRRAAADSAAAMSPAPGDSLAALSPAASDSAAAAEAALAALHRSGYFAARIDSVSLADARVYATAGRAVVIGSVDVILASNAAGTRVPGDVSESLPASLRDSLAGRPYSAAGVEAAIRRVLAEFESEGLPRAEVRVRTAELAPDGTGLDLRLEVDPGPRPVLQGVLLQGTQRTRPRAVEKLIGVRSGRTLASFDAQAMRRRLEETGFFDRVETPLLLSTGDSTAVIQIVASEASPGAFDAALGYQPGTGGGLVGSGRLELLNPLGAGRRFSVLFDRLPGQVSRAEIHMADPSLIGAGFGAEARFAGLQQDSTFGRQTWEAIGLWEPAPASVLTISYTRENVKPGTAGARISGTRQLVARTEAALVGVGFRLGRTDDRLNPSRGYRIDVRLERGYSERRAFTVDSAADTAEVATRSRLERLTGSGRLFLPAGGRRTVAVGFDGAVVSVANPDRGDLLRLGGARSLRGYDEDQFEGTAVGRVLAEGRYRMDRRTYAYLFADLGWIHQPASPGRAERSGFHPGFGFGAQIDTAAGLVVATYGFNPDDGVTRGRIHVSFSFGL